MFKKNHLAIAIAIAALGLAGVAQADIVTIFNTGVNASGVPLTDGTMNDPHYSLTSAPGGSSTTTLVRTAAGGFPIGPWLGDDSASAWIRPDNPGTNDPAGDYIFTTTFDLTGFDLSTVVLMFQWSTDNSGSDVRINGVSQGIAASGFTTWTGPETINSGFVAGVNTLDFVVHNDVQATGNPTGLRVEFTSATGTRTSVPEPAAPVQFGAMFAAGLGAFAMLRRRMA